ncbi:MAG: cysteine--tRNA ligase, partial [Dehalococcoidia bacterium]
MYVCGVTPYEDSHLGHAMSYIIFDVIRRHLEFRGYRVKHVQNFTDIDDKIILRAASHGVSPQNLVEGLIAQYFIDMDALNIQRAHVYHRATQEIPEMIQMIKTLIDKGHAYQANGDVYFRVESMPEYGKLSNRTLDGMVVGARLEVGEKKKHPMDFALWKEAKAGEPYWDSPWGKGRPGWHMECSTMALKYLETDTLDIHGGGQDLIFPHHENEIAQSECFTGVTPFIQYWIHNGLMQLGEEKMSKSVGNLITVKAALSRYGADAIRLFVLSSYYRSPLKYSEDSLSAMQRGAARLRNAARMESPGAGDGTSVEPEPYRQRFLESMDDDFNTSQAVAALFDLAREINKGYEAGAGTTGAIKTLRELAGLLGLTLEEEAREKYLAAEPFINLLISTRDELREAKQWDLADKIREELERLGVALEDTSKGTLWKHKEENPPPDLA